MGRCACQSFAHARCVRGAPASLYAEIDDSAGKAIGERRHGWIVRIQGKRRRGWERLERIAPAFGDEIHFAVAVELVAKEVGDDDDAWPEIRHDLRKRRLVHLKDKRRVAALTQGSRCRGAVEQRRRHATREVRTFAVAPDP